MFITASCLWLIKLRWSKNKSHASDAPHCAYYQCVAHIYFFSFLLLLLLPPRPPLPSPQKINGMWISHFLPDWSPSFPPKVIVGARVVPLDSAVLLPRACSVRQSTSCSKTKMEEQVDGKNSLIEHQLAPFAVIYHVLQTLTLKCTLQEIAQLDLLCKQLYEATDAATRNAAERALANFTNSPDCLRKCQYLLERGNVSFSTFLRVILVKFSSSFSLICYRAPLWPRKTYQTLHDLSFSLFKLQWFPLEFIQIPYERIVIDTLLKLIFVKLIFKIVSYF